MELIARYLLDTNAVIFLLNGSLASPLPKGNYSISIITEIELLSFAGLSDQEEQKIRDFLSVLDRIPLSDSVRDQAILLRRNNRLKLPDAIIAASALTQQAILLTNDQTLSAVDGLSCQSLLLK